MCKAERSISGRLAEVWIKQIKMCAALKMVTKFRNVQCFNKDYETSSVTSCKKDQFSANKHIHQTVYLKDKYLIETLWQGILKGLCNGNVAHMFCTSAETVNCRGGNLGL